MNIKISFLVAALTIAGPFALAAVPEAVTPPEGSTITAAGEIVYPPLPDRPRIRLERTIRSLRDLQGKKGNALGNLLSFMSGGGDTDTSLFDRPHGIWKQGGKLYVTDASAGGVVIMDLITARPTALASQGEGRLSSPVGITVDADGTIFVADTGDNTVKAYTEKGKLLWKAGSLGDAGGKLNRPGAVSLTPAGELLVLDTGNQRAVVLGKDGRFLREMCSVAKKAPGSLPNPSNLWVEKNGDFLVSDPLSSRVHIFTSTGAFLSGFGERGDSMGYLARPRGVASDSEGNIYVADALFGRIQIFDRQGGILLDFASPGAGPGELMLPAGMFMDSDDKMYVVDSKNQRIHIYQYIKYPENPAENPPAAASGEKK